jgi:hypothetical protein
MKGEGRDFYATLSLFPTTLGNYVYPFLKLNPHVPSAIDWGIESNYLAKLRTCPQFSF